MPSPAEMARMIAECEAGSQPPPMDEFERATINKCIQDQLKAIKPVSWAQYKETLPMDMRDDPEPGSHSFISSDEVANAFALVSRRD